MLFETPTKRKLKPMRKNDAQLKRDVENELLSNPRINATQIGVAVDRGVVSLMGKVDTYAEKWAVEDVTKKVGGVRMIAEDLTVRLPNPHQHTDAEIAEIALSALEWNTSVPETVTATIHNGRVTLQGEVQWNYQREAAEHAVRYLEGVVSLDDDIVIRASAASGGLSAKIRAAFQRQQMDQESSIQVRTDGGCVTLSGKATSWHDFANAADAVWAVDGVTDVADELTY
jgi:VCBS repeat-containing protein